MKSLKLILIVFSLSIFFSCSVFDREAKVISKKSFLLYLPSGLKSNKKYPLVIALSPSGHAGSMLAVWKEVSEKYKWIILGSKKFRNRVDSGPIFSDIVVSINTLAKKYPIDKDRVIVTGLSGGGMGAHYFAFLYPNLIRAVVPNVGFINKYLLKEKKDYPKGKLVVFLAGTGDFNYNYMKADKDFLESLGWKAKWIEFKGGHSHASKEAFIDTARWLTKQFHSAK